MHTRNIAEYQQDSQDMTNQRYLNYLFKLSLFVASLCPCGILLAAPAIDPSLVSYAKSLSPEEQKRLAAQYGVTLPTTVVNAPVSANRREVTEAARRENNLRANC